MKTRISIKHILMSLPVVACTLASCEFLDLKPISEASSVNFYKTPADIETAINACYASLQSNNMYRGNFVTMMEVRSDNVSDNNSGASGGIYYNIDRFMAGADNSVVGDVWATCYNQIYRINSVLQHIDVVTNPAQRAQYEGEARFLRALTYFNMVRFWGDIPLVLDPITTQEAYQLKRDPVETVYASIEGDLQLAQSLPKSYSDNDDLGRATSGAAKALLAKVYLTEKKYAEAVTLLQDLTTNYTDVYGLEGNVADVFRVDNKLNKEILFAVHYSKSISGETSSIHDAYSKFDLADELYDGYARNDARAELIESTRIDGQYIVNKFADTKDPNTLGVGVDFPVLRYSDVLLMYAEALNEAGYDANESGAAFTALNQVRTRSGATALTAADLPDQDTFRQAVWQERRLELALEGHRWFDLVRTGQAIEAMRAVKLDITEDDLLYPIPESEILIMNNPTTFPQNPGY